MSDYIQTLAQLLAQQQHMGTQQVSSPQVSQLGWANGAANQGYGQLGEAFGKGVGDYVNSTYVDAQKKQYAMENDPIEIQKRAAKFYGIYNNMPSAEQDKVDKWLNETPEGLKWLDKLNKHAGYLMTKVPLSEADSKLPPGVAVDDRQIYRPLRTLQSEDAMKSQARAAMTPEQRNASLFAQEHATTANAAAATSNAEANRLQAEGQRQLIPSQIAENKAKAGYYGRVPVVRPNQAGTADTYGLRVRLEEHRARIGEARKVEENLNAKLNNLMKDDSILDKEGHALQYRIEAAGELRRLNPLGDRSLSLYESAAQRLLTQRDSENVKVRQKAGVQAKQLLSDWARGISTTKSLQLYRRTAASLVPFYSAQMFPEAKTTEDQKAAVAKFLSSINSPVLSAAVAEEEKELRRQQAELFSFPMSPTNPQEE